MRMVSLSIVISFFIALVAGCSSIDKIDASTPEGAYKLAEEYEKDERYEEAVQKYQDVRSKHPYSKFATQAELKIADVHFAREAYIEAASAYQLFKDFHPKNPQSDYVTYRLALSYYNQLPSTIDRDLSVADKAILYFDELLNSYPQSQYVADARKKKEAAIKMQAERELYIANFYFKREIFDSALARFEFLLKTYPNLGLDSKALFGAAKSAFSLGDKERGLQHYHKLTGLFPSSEEARKAKSEFSQYGAN